MYMRPAAKQLEEALASCCPKASEEHCPVCSCPRGPVAQHITSPQHWEKIVQKLPSAPSPQEAVKWDQPWIEVFVFLRQEYLFNHITGEQGLRHSYGQVASPRVSRPSVSTPISSSAVCTEVSKIAPPPPTSIGPPPGAPPLPANQAKMPQMLPRSPVSQSKQVDRSEVAKRPCATDIWVWQEMIRPGAETLSQELRARGCGCPGSPPVFCDVCMQQCIDIREHILSADHYTNLRIKMDYKSPPREKISNGPWLQKTFTRGDNIIVQVSFNHITGSVQCPQQVPHQAAAHMQPQAQFLAREEV